MYVRIWHISNGHKIAYSIGKRIKSGYMGICITTSI